MPSVSEARLEGRAAIVTGAAQGIGARYAAALAAAGAAVACCDVLDAEPVAARIRDAGGRAIALRVDVTSQESARAMAAATLEAFGRIDVLVNNAGLFANLAMKPFDQIDAAEWDRVMAVNVRGTWLMTRACCAALAASGRGAVVNLASDTALWGATNLMAYVASKGAVIAMTHSLARELGTDNTTVNAIAPGLVMVEATQYVPEARHRQYVDQRALQREQLPEDVCGPVVFALSDMARFVTGQLLPVNGGFVFN